MPIIAVIIALFLPRLLIFILWLATGWFNGVFETRLWPLLGFFFLPLTLLWYSEVENWFGGVWDWWHALILVIAILMDLSSDKSSKRKKGA